tara:strand:- start:81 stop:347 length:267 start_codon:yes stop_codon:yes gene_type:complete
LDFDPDCCLPRRQFDGGRVRRFRGLSHYAYLFGFGGGGATGALAMGCCEFIETFSLLCGLVTMVGAGFVSLLLLSFSPLILCLSMLLI